MINAIQTHPQGGTVALHLEDVTEITTDAAQLLKSRLELWTQGEGTRIIYLYVVAGEVPKVLESTGLFEENGRHQLIYMSPKTGEQLARTVTLTEIAEILGVTLQRTSVVVRQPGFPKPMGREGQSRLWCRREVTAWAKVWRREKPWRQRPSAKISRSTITAFSPENAF